MIQNFKGFCSYPLGGYVSAGLFVCSGFALAATIYGTASCTFVTVTFESDAGTFEEYFTSGPSATGDPILMTHKVGAGLFTWLRPVTPQSDWSDGSCAGYQQSMLQVLQDNYLDTSRTFAIIAVLMSILMTAWAFLTACMDLNVIQTFLLRGLLFLGTLSTGMTFLFLKSTLCTTAFNDSVQCQIGQGGLVMSGGTLMWFATLIISMVYVHATILDDETIQKRQDEKDRLKMQREIQRARKVSSKPDMTTSYSYDSTKDWQHPIPSRTSSSTKQQQQQQQSKQSSTTRKPISVNTVNQREPTEKYVKNRLDRIEQLTEV